MANRCQRPVPWFGSPAQAANPICHALDNSAAKWRHAAEFLELCTVLKSGTASMYQDCHAGVTSLLTFRALILTICAQLASVPGPAAWHAHVVFCRGDTPSASTRRGPRGSSRPGPSGSKIPPGKCPSEPPEPRTRGARPLVYGSGPTDARMAMEAPPSADGHGEPGRGADTARS
jgi:hypothetical protein